MKRSNITISPPLLMPKSGDGDKEYTKEELFSFARYFIASRLKNNKVAIQDLLVNWENNGRWDRVEQVPLDKFEEVR